jgi:hypothetical protein
MGFQQPSEAQGSRSRRIIAKARRSPPIISTVAGRQETAGKGGEPWNQTVHGIDGAGSKRRTLKGDEGQTQSNCELTRTESAER